jgi:hypothetical protein
MSELIEEPIEVFAAFRGTRVEPRIFRWQGHTYHLRRVTFVHTTRQGRSKLFYFSATDGVNFFKLCFDSETLIWRLAEIEIPSP